MRTFMPTNKLSRFMSGELLVLQTDGMHYGHGYGSLVVKSISKQIAQLDNDVYASVLDDNTPSKRLFEKIGFEPVERINRITTKPS